MLPPPNEPERRVPAETVADVCAFVDDLDGPAGEIVVEHEAGRGAVFVEDGRVCWAAAPGLSRRLGELLVSYASIDRAQMEALFFRCKEERKPLGEVLVAEGIVSARDLRAVLARHTTESLLALVGPRRRALFRPRPRGGYSPQFTFGTAEIVTRAAATLDRETAERAEAGLEEWLAREAWGAAFVRRPTRAVPEPIALVGRGPATARDLASVAKWAASALDVVAAFGKEGATLYVLRPECVRVFGRDFLVARRSGDVLSVGEAREEWVAASARTFARGASP